MVQSLASAFVGVAAAGSTVSTDEGAERAEAEPAQTLNGFRLEKLAVPRGDILKGGPPRDGIRSVDEPRFVAPEQAAVWVRAETPVLGVSLGGVARAYPIHLLEYHQVVNDTLGEVAVVVTYDPLSGTPLAYLAGAGGSRLTFGVSGLIRESNFLLYDRETESLWTQIGGLAIAGPQSGERLTRARVRQEPFGVWREREPKTTVLVRPEPDRIHYAFSPFSSYWVSAEIPFPVKEVDERFHPKEVVLGVEVEGAARSYLGSILTTSGGRIVDDFRGRKIRIDYDSDTSTFVWEAPDDVLVMDAYWFAWKAFRPQADVWRDSAVPIAGGEDVE